MHYFHMSSMRPCSIQGTIEFEKDPKWRFGNHKDTKGEWWNINGYVNGCVLATKTDLIDPYYNSTETNAYIGYHSQSWEPYKFTVKGY